MIVETETPPPFPPERCRGEKCSHTPGHNHETDKPEGPECGREANQVIYWRDGRASPSCEEHGRSSLDPSALPLILCVHPIGDLHVFAFADEEWVVAESPEDASALFDSMFGVKLPDPESGGEWIALPDDKPWTLNDDGEKTTKTCKEWSAGGRRYLGSANY